MGVCATRDSGCKSDEDKASKGFIAARLTTDIDPADKPEECEGKLSAEDAEAVSAPSAEGHIAKAVVEVYNKCTKKTKTLAAQHVHVEAPLILKKDAAGNLVAVKSPFGGGAGILGASAQSLDGLGSAGSMEIPESMAAVARQHADNGSESGFFPGSQDSSTLKRLIDKAVHKALVKKNSKKNKSSSHRGSKSHSGKSHGSKSHSGRRHGNSTVASTSK